MARAPTPPLKSLTSLLPLGATLPPYSASWPYLLPYLHKRIFLFVDVLIAIITLPDFFERRIREAQRTCTHPTEQPNVECDPMNSHVETFDVFEATWIGTQLDWYGWSYANAALFVFIPLIILAIFNAAAYQI